MCHDKILRWTGLAASVLCALFSGIFLSFNVYAVQLKAKFELNQTQVEFVGSFMMAALIFAFTGYFLINKYGYVICYVTAWALVTSSDVLMWLATQYTEFFGKWIGFLCLFLFTNTLGASLCEMCSISFSLKQFHKRHAGKIIGVYLAGVALGKVYYAALYKIVFKTEERLGDFFLSVPVGFTVSIAVCILCQRFTLDKDDSEQIPLTPAKDCEKCEEQPSSSDVDRTENRPGNMSLKTIVKSWAFHLFLWPNATFVGCNTTLMNNITTIAHDIGMKHSEITIYIFSAGIILSRASFGSLFDFFGTPITGMWLLIFCHLTFAVAMVIGWFWLDHVTVIVMTVLSSVGVGVGFSLSLTILSLEFGLEHYSFVMGILEFGMTISLFLSQLFTGITHDHIARTFSNQCLDHNCFAWSFVCLFTGSMVAASFTLVKIFLTRR